jgi:glycosyltransferase involved in cell wall biosynthesis
MSIKLLSICIPTYNRCDILDKTLMNLFSNPDFDENKIEIIVSDNASTDNTSEIVAKYPLVKYYRNSENIRDLNFSKTLEYATGSYIRLFNDTLTFRKNALNSMLANIEKHLGEDVNLFFFANILSNTNCLKEIIGKSDFLKTASFGSTWIASFGIWRNDFIKISNKNRFADLQFVQVDWCFRIVENNKKTLIYFEDMFDVFIPKKKGGYNIIKTFTNNYLYIIKQEGVNFIIYEIEKYRLCRYFLY